MKIPALVLTYDDNRFCTENMILQYERLMGPETFQFIIPYQENKTIDNRIESEVLFVLSDVSIAQTIAALLRSVPRDKMVYWCIDDKYPIQMDVLAYRSVLNFLRKEDDIDGISLAMARRLSYGLGLTRKSKKFAGIKEKNFHRRLNFNQFWLHQFIKPMCLEFVFNEIPKELGAAKEMDYYVGQINENPFKMYVSQENFITFGESTHRGLVTPNLLQAASENRIEVPPSRQVSERGSIIIGEMNSKVSRRFRWFGF